MYKHILLPVDGSEFSMGVVASAMKLAATTGAEVTALTVTAPYRAVAVGELAAHMDEREYDKRTDGNANAILLKVKDAAKAAGVTIHAVHAYHAHPWEAIIAEAADKKCDLIMMASHGRRGLTGLLIGSETKKVLTHTSIPVLVWRG